jgi:predicted dehydrogenase
MSQMDRRTFLKGSAAGLTASALAGYVAYAADSKPMRVGVIGTGWYGKCDVFRLIQVAPVDVVSICDVDKKMLAEAGETIAGRQASHKTPRLFHDYRDMLKEKDLDIVLVGTPDHWHALAMIAACEAGADVYCQKPISVDVAEGQAMLATARKLKRVVQIGTQRRSTPHLIEAREKFVKSGALGKIGYAEIYCLFHMRNGGNPPDTQPPPNLDYEMWTGPAPMRPYNKLVHPKSWRLFMEYCNGIMGDMGVHMLDMVRWMLDLGAPKSVSSIGGILVDKNLKANTSDTQSAAFDYDDLKIVWTHRTWGDDLGEQRYPWGATIYGDKGRLEASVMGYTFTPMKGPPVHKDWVNELDKYPEDKTEKDLEKHVAPAIRGHMKNFLDCIATREKPVADIEQGYISTAACILANMSMALGGRELKWDAEKGVVIGDDEANKLLKRPYRAPWQHPGQSS